VVLKLLGLDRAMYVETGISYGGLLAYAAVVGFTGSIISLLMSKQAAKWSTGAHVIEQPANEPEAWLVETVRKLATKAGIGMPEVAIYEGAPNAFATGAFKNSALVAVSTGLLQSMSKEEVEAVLGHEIAHVANGDMVTLTLIQGVVNTFVFVASRLIGNIVDKVVFRNERGHGPAFWITTMVAELVLAFLATMIVMWFSRQREFRADAGGARLAGRQNMISALESLGRGQAESLPDRRRPGTAAAGRRIEEAVHEPSANRGTHRGIARRCVRCRAWPGFPARFRNHNCRP
jgi:heat shock protein HtpX